MGLRTAIARGYLHCLVKIVKRTEAKPWSRRWMENCTGWILNWLLDGDIINLYTTQQGSVGRPVAQTKTSTLFENMLMLTLAVARTMDF